ncbi:TPA: hypothetical protein R4Y37_001603 [Citrobacter freundii]|nr:hypothetical protein [Citrobacter freundii]
MIKKIKISGYRIYKQLIFLPEWGFPKTKSENHTVTCHDGVFLVMKEDVEDYIKAFKP